MGLVLRFLAGFAVALCCTPAGVSGAFMLLPVQLHVFHVPSPAVTATNLLYNVVSTPAGALAFWRAGNLDRVLTTGLVLGTTPAVIVGVLLRSTWLASDEVFAVLAGAMLVGLGLRLARLVSKPTPARDDEGLDHRRLPAGRLATIGWCGGLIGGIYGLGGAAVIVPWLVGVEGLSPRRMAGPGLVTTLITSLVGSLAFVLAAWLSIGNAAPPRWADGLALGVGGAIGGLLGVRLQPHVPIRILQGILAFAALAAGVRTLL
jgi:uncharacterized protein